MAHTLLLADDSVTIQRVIELTFADEDVQVVAVSSGDEAIAVLNRTPPDIVLADDSGVCFIPRDRAAEVLELARRKVAAEEAKCKAIDAGIPVPDLPGNA